VTLGLFPLNLVLFPHAQVPLHIYEPRYKSLINECLEGGKEFGINLVEQGHLHPVGCLAKVVEVTDRFPDGRMNVIVEGQGRFRLLNVSDNPSPYVIGEAEVVMDEEGAPTDPILVSLCAGLYNNIIDLVYGTGSQHFDTEKIDDRSPAFLMAPKSGLSSEQKQQLIEMTSENARLEMLKEHLSDIVPAIEKAEMQQRIIKSDGYQNNL